MVAVLAGYTEKARRQTWRFMKVASRYGIEREARRLMKHLGWPEGNDVQIPPETGWVRFDAAAIPGLRDSVKRLRELGEAWVADERRWINQKSWPHKLTQSDDLLAHPEIVDVALNETLLRAAAAYYGQVPRLYRLAIWWSPPNKTLQGSQLFHYDGLDSRQAKLFINLKDVTSAAGPLHFLDAAQSAQFNAKVGYSQERIADEDVFSIFKPSDLHTTVGSAGEGFFLDTGRCLHYGSRGNSEGRLMFMVNYARINCIDPGKGCPVLDPVRKELARTRYAGDPVRNYALTAPL
jgi:hypothetical protein